jgi:hypothetical protein
METNRAPNYRTNLQDLHRPMVSRVIRKALSQGRRLGPTLYAHIREQAVRAALQGAFFLISNDEIAGNSCYACLAHIEMAELPEIAWLVGTLATLIAAAVKMDTGQGRISGKAFVAWFESETDRKAVWAEGAAMWLTENPKREAA